MQSFPPFRFARAAAVLFGVALWGGSMLTGQVYWDNGNGNSAWGTAANWSNNAVPGSTTDLIFDATYVSTDQSINLASTNRSARTLTFSSALNYTLSNTATNRRLQIYGTGTNLTQSGSGNVVINNPVWLSTGLFMDGAGTGLVTINGVISDGPGTDNVQKNGSFTLVLNGNNTQDGTLLNAGTIEFGHDAGAGALGLTLNGGTIRAGGAARTLSNAVTVGGNFTVGGSLDLTLSGAMGLGGATRTVTVDNSGATTFSGIISNGGLTKAGAGTLTLSGGSSSTYASGTTINDGTIIASKTANRNALGTGTVTIGDSSGAANSAVLQLGVANQISDTSAITVNSDGRFDLNNHSETVGSIAGSGNIALGTATLTAGDDDTSTTFSGVISETGGFTKSGTGTTTLSGNNTYTGATTVSAGTLRLGAAGDATNTALGTTAAGTSVTSGAALDLNGFTLGTAEGLTLNGTGVSNTGALTNSSATAASYSGAITLGSATAIGGTGDITLSGVISGANNLTKEGNNTLTLTTSNSYTGSTTLNAGVLSIAAGNYLGATPGSPTANKLVFNGGTLQTTATTLINLNRGVTINAGGGTIDVATGTTLGYAGILTGAGTFNKTGTGTFTLDGTTTNTHTGAINVDFGTLVIAKTVANTAIGDTAAVTVASGATFALNGGVGETVGSIAGAGTIDNTNATAVTLTAGGNNSFTAFSGTIQDTGGNLSITKAGTGTTTLSGANTYAGATTISAGALNIQSNTALGDTTTGTTVASGAALEIQNGYTVTGEALTISGTGIGANGAVRNISGTNTWAGTVALAAASQIQSDAGTLTISGDVSSTNLALTLDGAGNTVLSGAVGLGTGTVTKTGTGTATLSGANTYTGLTTVSAGVLNIRSNTGLGTTAAGTSVTSGAALEIQSSIVTTNIGAEAITLNGTGVSSGGALRNISGNNSIAGAITLGSATRINSDAGTLTLSGAVSGAAQNLTVGGAGATTLTGIIGTTTGTFTKDGSGTATLAGTSNNTYSGTTTVNDGTLNLNKTAGQNATGTGNITVGDGAGGASSANLVLLADNQIANTSGVTINADGRFTTGAFTESIATLAGTGLLELSTGGYLTVGADNSSSTFGGSITGLGTLEKAGTGTLTFNSTISYTGALTLSAGTLQLSGVTATIGTLNVTGNSTIDFAGSAATLSLTNLTISAGVTLSIINWADATDFFYTANWTGAVLDTRGVAPMNQVVFATFTGNNTQWQSYDHQITPVPEPATYGAMLFGALGALAGLRRWRRRLG